MGYTHYYYTAERFDPARFAAVAADFERMVAPLNRLGVVLADGLGEGVPSISPTEIRFNGDRTRSVDCSYETFEFLPDNGYAETPAGRKRRDPVSRHENPRFNGKYFNFCKTGRRPYDLAVNVCLVIAKHHLGEDIMVDSDGTMEDWREAMLLCDHFLGYGMDFCLDDGKSSPIGNAQTGSARVPDV